MVNELKTTVPGAKHLEAVKPSVEKALSERRRTKLTGEIPKDIIKPSDSMLEAMRTQDRKAVQEVISKDKKSAPRMALEKIVQLVTRKAVVENSPSVSDESTKPEPQLPEHLVEIARLSGWAIEEYMEKSDGASVSQDAEILGDVVVSDVNVENRYGINMNTTHLSDEDPTRIGANYMIVDLKAENIDTMGQQSDSTILFGKKDGQYRIIGQQKKLIENVQEGNADESTLSADLKSRGYQDIGYFSIADFDRFVDHMPKNSEVPA